MHTFNLSKLANKYFYEAGAIAKELPDAPNVLAFIASEDEPSLAYARATRQRFLQAGFKYELRTVNRLDLEPEILAANEDPSIHGIFIYYPIFANRQDDFLRNQVHYTKDIEAGSQYWTRKLYANERHALDHQPEKKAVLPCTPLAIVKLLVELGVYREHVHDNSKPLQGRTVAIFNRSEVIGRPLAVMLSNEGARVLSFDEQGPLEFIDAHPREIEIDRSEALMAADIVITGVPSTTFSPITASEIRPNTACINFSSINNFSEDITTQTPLFLPRVGPMTVAMCLRNTLRLYQNFHQEAGL
jgi:5,10-methylene-tetrahydrofolate dehydrogenase/methenyl tetrahydrofolate cyclohydrolase